ncbi:MAG TPA: EAL domain-containing protein, partial [Phycisphaerales bacterium]|nr:EAL domain-containing protein [Phycisphaerales bacterium]
AVPAIIHAIVTLANHLKLQVVAEGIESSDQMAGVIALECDYAQGYLISKPMTVDELLPWMRNRERRPIAA